MPLPPKGDPTRPLHLAISSTRLWGIIFLSLGSLALFSMLRFSFFRTPWRFAFLLLALRAFVFIGPGAAYLVVAFYLKRRQRWAVVAGLVLTGVQLLLLLTGAIALVVFVLSETDNMVALIPLAFLGMIIVALAQLVYNLARSFEAIKHVPVDEHRGFEPLMVLPMNPPVMTED